MRINYFFPIFKNDDAKACIERFFKTENFKKHKDYKMVFCCHEQDKTNLKYLKEIKNKNVEVLALNEQFSYNDAFNNAIEHFDGDVVLLGDCKIEKIDVVFEKCLEKNKQGASVVHVVKRYRGFKSFLYGLFHPIYNFFVKIFTNKKDRLNAVSLGLIDKDVIDVLKTLPKKRCFLKNTKDLLGFDTRTIYIDGRTTLYALNYKEKTASLTTAKIATGVNVISLLLIILLNCFLKLPIAINIVLGVMLFSSIVVIALFLPKHFFDVRNFPSKKVFKVKEIKGDKKDDRWKVKKISTQFG